MQGRPESRVYHIRSLLNAACLVGLSTPLKLSTRPYNRDCATFFKNNPRHSVAQGCNAPHPTAANIHNASLHPTFANLTGVMFLQSSLGVGVISSTPTTELSLYICIAGLLASILVAFCIFAEIRSGAIDLSDKNGETAIIGYRSAARRSGNLIRREPSSRQALAQGVNQSQLSTIGVGQMPFMSSGSVNSGVAAASKRMQADSTLQAPSSTIQQVPPSLPTSLIVDNSISPTPASSISPVLNPASTILPVPPQLPVSQRVQFPPLCKDMLLTNCGAWFAVDMRLLEEGASHFELFVHSGTPLLRAAVQTDEAGEPNMISISMRAKQRPSLGSIVCHSSMAQSEELRMDIMGKGGALYGSLRSIGPMTFGLSVASQEIMQMHFDTTASQLLARSSQDGASLACAERCVQNANFHDEHLEVTVNPGVDAILVLLCVLGIIIIAPVKGHEGPRALSLGTLSRHSDS